jgi:histidine triad (HIT) family protein
VTSGSVSDCPFCDWNGATLWDTGLERVIRPLNPVTEGHVLVIPYEHIRDATENPVVFGQVANAAATYARAHDLAPCNLITSCGSEATQTLFHLHVHVVPRRKGDGLTLPWTHFHPHGDAGVEAISAKLHEIYQAEAHRRGDVRHADAYDDLSEAVKEWDRVLARWILAHWTPRFDSTNEVLPP